MRDPVKREEQLIPENFRHQRRRRSRGHDAETTEREGLEIMDWTEEQAAWSAGKAKKSKPGVEKSRLKAERLGWGGGTRTEAETGL